MARLALFLISLAVGLNMITGTKVWAEDTPATVVEAISGVYQLVGTVEGSPDATFAVFENPQTKQQKIYRIGDTVNGAKILEIKQQSVILKQGSQIVIVRITGGSAVEEKAVKSAPAEAEIPAPKKALERALSKQIPPYSSAVQKTAVNEGIVNHLSGQLQRYTEKSTHFADTSFGNGIRAADLGNDVATSLGLDPSDVIVGISGMGIESRDQLRQMIEILNRAKVFNLSVIHDSNAKSMSYEKESGQ